ncbi:MAG: aminopeptidase P family protein [Oscillospiraceae bacterium]|nr:aminopeptidase P family protein [Oscillospiraceae bacterium]
MNHLSKIKEQLHKYGIEAMLITAEPGEAYAIGFRGEGVVLVTEDECDYYTDSRYIEAAEAQVTGCNIQVIGGGKGHLALAKEDIARLGLTRIGIQEEYLTLLSFNSWRKTLGEGMTLVPAGQLVADLRAAKDEEELALMRKAQAITDRTFTEILNHVKEGVTEQEIAALITYYHMKFGASKNSFDPIVASGPNGSMPHAIPSDKPIRKGEFVTMDFGSIYGGYCSDMTRTVAVGQPTEEMERVYHIVAEAQLKGIAAARAGVIGREVDKAARDIITEVGYGDYFGHGLGHSLGLEIHEDPGFRSGCKEAIPAGAVVSVEPGIYLPGRFGVRIEDVVVVREDGCEVMTKSPKQLMVL